ncbi:cytochrome c family protein [Sphingomonas sp. 1P06PA]|uniref:c-type cytochrome n=1 Tax=Sphingomonas sp. 1P06PA TaxID=554121 RepID=UPI0039A4F82F
MDDRANMIAGWALAGGIAALGLSILTGEYFHAERPEKMGYVVEGVEAEAGEGGAAAEQPIETYLASATPAQGEAVFKKCAACHNANSGGANGVGPNLYHVFGEPVGKGKGFAFSEALAGKGGTWNWQNMSEWLKSPKAFAPGTKMTFAGLSKPEDRAAVMLYLNQQSPAPLPIPAAPAAAAPAADGATPAADAAAGSTPEGGNSTVQTEAQAAKSPEGNIAGEGAPATSGTAAQEKN